MTKMMLRHFCKIQEMSASTDPVSSYIENGTCAIYTDYGNCGCDVSVHISLATSRRSMTLICIVKNKINQITPRSPVHPT